MGPEEAVIGCGRERRAVTRPVAFDAPTPPHPWAALTFDDGPDPLWTPRILDALDRAGARATFFVVAPLAVEYRDIVAAAHKAGHQIEFHCTAHVRHTRCSRHEVETDTREGLEMLRNIGIEPRLWRPPWGVLAPWTERIAEDFGLRLAPWSADTHDWRGDAAAEMLNGVEPLLGPGSIVLMHDGLGPGSLRSGCRETVALVEPLVALLRSMGCKPALMFRDEPAQASPSVGIRKAEA